MENIILRLLATAGLGAMCYFIGRLDEMAKQRQYLLAQLDEQVSEFKKQLAKLSTTTELADLGQKVADQVKEQIAEELGDAEHRGDNQ